MHKTLGWERNTDAFFLTRIPATATVYLSLVKFQLSLFISISCIWGYILYQPQFTRQTTFMAIGIFLLACGAAALNNVQDRSFDLQFSRTRKRPLPSGKISNPAAISIAIFHIGFGLLSLGWNAPDAMPFLLGMASIVLYNCIYTPLKKRTVLSIFPGAVCGMLPPYIGWLAAGGSEFGFIIGNAMLIIGLWQFPHFWLVLINSDSEFSGSQYHNMLRLFSARQLHRILAIWVGAMVTTVSCLPLIYRFWHQSIFWAVYAFGILTLTLFFVSSFRPIIRSRSLFVFLNTFLLALMTGMICDRLL